MNWSPLAFGDEGSSRLQPRRSARGARPPTPSNGATSSRVPRPIAHQTHRHHYFFTQPARSTATATIPNTPRPAKPHLDRPVDVEVLKSWTTISPTSAAGTRRVYSNGATRRGLRRAAPAAPAAPGHRSGERRRGVVAHRDRLNTIFARGLGRPSPRSFRAGESRRSRHPAAIPRRRSRIPWQPGRLMPPSGGTAACSGAQMPFTLPATCISATPV